MRKFREVTGTSAPQKRFEVQMNGPDLLHEPFLNKGDAFTTQERESFGLTGLLPTAVTTLDEQVKRAYLQYQQQPDDPRKNMY
ncbi:MAG TPA: NAD-dependent malic enzyme, partial [Ktedonobacteraceae bacterium]|nr:NAD-dependent malic enzyme [Ktedonobacteraceae bacterium]